MATSNEAEKARHALRRRRRLRQVLGAVVCVLVVIGLASVISGGARLTASLFDDTEEKEEFELRLQTLVSRWTRSLLIHWKAQTARACWTRPSGASSKTATVWTYERDEVGAMYLPTLDIDRAVASLYGPDFHFNYETFTDNGLTFQYVPEKNAYLLPITSVNGNYSPRVMQIRREGSTKRVTVGYLDLYGSGEIVFDPTKLEPAKYMDYIFTRSGDAYYLTAITESEMKAESPDGFRLFRWSAGACCPAGPGDGQCGLGSARERGTRTERFRLGKHNHGPGFRAGRITAKTPPILRWAVFL
ncbi:MAG: hypothetical protein V8T36_06345 [Ruthenibacterium lactatiformans]